MPSELDIVSRLRECADMFASGPSAPVMREAAHIIESLRRSVEEARGDTQVARQQGMPNR